MEYIIVQAGGKGKRLGHLTKNKPKALVPVENLPMLFHLFRKYSDKYFVIIADYQKEVLHEYLFAFADVKYQIVDAEGTGTCAGIKQALALIPDKQPFMLIWSDLILPREFALPEEYEEKGFVKKDYVGISKTFPCRWSFVDGQFIEERSCENGVAGFFLFTDKSKLGNVPQSGELVRWMQQEGKKYEEISLAGTREFGLLEEYQKLDQEKCRPFNHITIHNNILTKKAVDAQGEKLAERECAWYEMAQQYMKSDLSILPEIYSRTPLKMKYIKGHNIYECDLNYEEKRQVLQKVVAELNKLHDAKQVPADSFSMKEAYYNKTMRRLSKIEDLVPFAREQEISINGKRCRNIYFHKRELEKKLEKITCEHFYFIHGDCTFSNLILQENGNPILIDPRGYFGYTELFGDIRYDWAKLYYSIVGNYDKFNRKDFQLQFTESGVQLEIASNNWEDMERDFFELTGADEQEIKLLHAIIWLSLTTYAWEDYDSICGAFYNGLYYLEDIL